MASVEVVAVVVDLWRPRVILKVESSGARVVVDPFCSMHSSAIVIRLSKSPAFLLSHSHVGHETNLGLE